MTTQMNLRISERLLEDMDFIARNFGVSRSEWVKVKFAEFVREQKRLVIAQIEYDFVYGRVNEKQFKDLTGFAPSKGLLYKKLQSKDGTESYIRDVLEKGNN